MVAEVGEGAAAGLLVCAFAQALQQGRAGGLVVVFEVPQTAR